MCSVAYFFANISCYFLFRWRSIACVNCVMCMKNYATNIYYMGQHKIEMINNKIMQYNQNDKE